MKLNTLKLKNFKGIKALDMEPQGQDMIIGGENATGKTTVADAFMWLLFGKDSRNRKDFEIKTLDSEGQPIHGLDHEVEAELDLEDGRTIALKKTYREQWTKKRGSAEATFSGHTIDHHIDGVPVKQKEYDAAIGKIAPEEAFRLLTDPRHFNENLHWEKRRKILLDVCGDVPDEEVIASDERLAKIPEIKGERTIEDQRKVIAEKRKEIQQDLERIPVRIDEVTTNAPDTSSLTDPETLKNQEEDVKTTIAGMQEQISRTNSGGEVAEKTKQLNEIESQLLALRNKEQEGQGKKVIEAQKELYAAQDQRSKLASQLTNAQKTAEYNKKNIADLERKIEAKREEWIQEDARQPEAEKGSCPTCGRPYEEGQAEKGRESFNQDKARNLEKISKDGKALKKEITALQEEVARQEQQAADTQQKIAEVDEEIEEHKAKTEEARGQMSEPTSTPEYKELLRQKTEIEAAIEEARSESRGGIENLKAEIRKLEEDLAEIQAQQQRWQQTDKVRARTEELKEQERELSKNYERLEQDLFLTEEFMRSKVKLLDERINSRFELARFKLFEQYISGGLEETCETTYQGIPYGRALNNGARINIGLDIIKTLAEYHNFRAPIFIDNAEAVTRIIPMEGNQIITLVVTDEPELTVTAV